MHIDLTKTECCIFTSKPQCCCRYNRTKIRWSRNDEFLGKSRQYHISKKGALRIDDIAYRNAGTYACHAGLSKADIRLTVKPKPGDPAPTEEDYADVPTAYGSGRNRGPGSSGLTDGQTAGGQK